MLTSALDSIKINLYKYIMTQNQKKVNKISINKLRFQNFFINVFPEPAAGKNPYIFGRIVLPGASIVRLQHRTYAEPEREILFSEKHGKLSGIRPEGYRDGGNRLQKYHKMRAGT